MKKEIISTLKEHQKEYMYGSDAYNVLRKLETLIPNIVQEHLRELENRYIDAHCNPDFKEVNKMKYIFEK